MPKLSRFHKTVVFQEIIPGTIHIENTNQSHLPRCSFQDIHFACTVFECQPTMESGKMIKEFAP